MAVQFLHPTQHLLFSTRLVKPKAERNSEIGDSVGASYNNKWSVGDSFVSFLTLQNEDDKIEVIDDGINMETAHHI